MVVRFPVRLPAAATAAAGSAHGTAGSERIGLLGCLSRFSSVGAQDNIISLFNLIACYLNVAVIVQAESYLHRFNIAGSIENPNLGNL